MLIYLLACSTTNLPATPSPVDPNGPATPFAEAPAGFVAHHPSMGTTSTISDDGVTYAGDTWSLLLRPRAFGRTDTAQPLSIQDAQLQGDKVVAGQDPQFWATHGDEGLEFGFDVAERPAGEGPLRVRFAIEGLDNAYGTGTDISFDTGTTLVHIDKLVVTDADGVQLDAFLDAECGDEALDQAGPCDLVIEVDDGAARYPLVIDPLLTTSPRIPGQKVAAGDPLVITEIMVNPTLVQDSRGEYIEITNTGPTTIDLSGLALWDDSNNYYALPNNGATIPAGGTFVFGRSTNPNNNGGAQVDQRTTNFFLANDPSDGNPDEVVIGIRASGNPCSASNPCTEIDRVVIDSDWLHVVSGIASPFIPQGGSFSLAPGKYDEDNDDPANWCDGLSPYGDGMFGTPNEINESCAFDLEFQYTFDLVAGGLAQECTYVRPKLDGTFSTGNRGEGTYQRYTRSSGQTLTWTYQYSGSPQPANPTVYTGDRLFGATTWSIGDIIQFDTSLATDGSWISPCPEIGDTGDTSDTDVNPPSDLIISQYVEGTGNNKFVEITNLSGAPVPVGTCSMRLYFNGSTVAGQEIFLTGSVGAGDSFVLCNSSASQTPPFGCDVSSNVLNFNGDDAIELACDGSPIDVIGQIGVNPGSSWGTSPLDTQDVNLRRVCSVSGGDPDGSDDFDPELAAEWEVISETNYVEDLGQYVCPYP